MRLYGRLTSMFLMQVNESLWCTKEWLAGLGYQFSCPLLLNMLHSVMCCLTLSFQKSISVDGSLFCCAALYFQLQRQGTEGL